MQGEHISSLLEITPGSPPYLVDLCAGHISEDSAISVVLGAGEPVDGVHQ